MQSTQNLTIGGMRNYSLKVYGVVDDDFAVSYCPMGTEITHEDKFIQLSNICADQSSILGLIRQLHNMGCIIISLQSV